jgi:hypothetical protein
VTRPQLFTCSWAAAVPSFLYFAIALTLMLAAILNPDGNVSGAASSLLTLPWSVLLLFTRHSVPLGAILIPFGAAINAGVLYVCLARLLRQYPVVVLAPGLMVATLFAGGGCGLSTSRR